MIVEPLETAVSDDATSPAAPKTVADLFAAAADLLPTLSKGSAERERERIMPFAEIREIAHAGLLTFRVPAEHGGPGASISELMRFLIDLAAVDSNIAQALRPSYSFVERLRSADDEQRQRWLPRVLAGEVFGNAGWERGGPNGEVRARITAEGDHFRGNGTKFYSTGALFADWVSLAVRNDDDEVVGVTVPRDREGLVLVDDWDGAGQRLTASGTTRLENLLVFADEIRHNRSRAPGERRPSHGTAVLQLHLGAVMAGIAKNALSDAIAFAKAHARPIKHSTADQAIEDPYVRLAVGEISVRAFAAESAILAAAASIDRAIEADEPANYTEARIEVAQAQFLAAESAMRAGELTFDVGGGSTTLREYNLDRHWRNARTVANHNPRLWKAAVVGAFRLDGSEPPDSGLF